MTECYDTLSNQDDTIYPCSTDGSVQQCCSLGYLCADNGLCVANSTQQEDTITDYFINGCTVQDWINGSVETCPTECLSTGGVGVSACDAGTFCCYGFGGCDCSNDTQVFSLGPVKIVATITGAPTTTTTSTTSTTSTSTNTSTGSTSATPTDGSSGGSSDGGSSSNLPVGLGVGLGVGIPVLLGLAAGIFLLLRRRRRAAGVPAGYQAAAGQPSSDGGYHQSPPSSTAYPSHAGEGAGATEYFKPHPQTDSVVTHELPARSEPAELQ
ncbi:hypothetical protein BJX99DRAFT_242294 [Aspergillus californicus]